MHAITFYPLLLVKKLTYNDALLPLLLRTACIDFNRAFGKNERQLQLTLLSLEK